MAPFDTSDLLRLRSVPGLGPLKLHALISHFGSPDAVLSALPRDLCRVTGISKKLARIIHRHRAPDDLVSGQLSMLHALGGSVVSYWDSAYPPLLKTIYDPPVLLYVLGDLRPGDEALLAIVGTRTASLYSEKVVAHIIPELVAAGYGIVSGLARGVDTLAHTATLRCHGRTIGVLGSGLDRPYPRENVDLMKEICRKGGAMISEFDMGTDPDAPNFPRRNRIVSGMTRGTVVVESGTDGGAMITASTALDQNREVFAVPGPVFNPMSEGPHVLIRDGRAKLVQHASAILEELPGGPQAGKTERLEPVDLTLFEQNIFELLSDVPVHLDQIAERTRIAVPDALVALLGLEFKRLARQLPGRFFVAL